MIMRKVILSSLFLIPLLGYSQTEIPDSIEGKELNEVVVEASNQRTSSTSSTYIPMSRQKNTASDAISLLSQMAIPQLNVDPASQNVKTVSGQAVSIFIDYVAASAQDLSGMRTTDVKKVEYLIYPTDPRFRGAQYVINFVMQKYEWGGYTKLSADKWFGVNRSEASVYSKFSYKRTTFDLYADEIYLTNRHTGTQSTETFRFPDLYGKGPQTVERVSIPAALRYRNNSNDITFRALYNTDKTQISNTLSLAFTSIPRNDATTSLTYANDFLPGSTAKSVASSNNFSLNYNFEIYRSFGEKLGMNIESRYNYDHNTSNSDYTDNDFRIINDAKEDMHYVSATPCLVWNPNNHNSLMPYMHAEYSTTKINYFGNSPSHQDYDIWGYMAGVKYTYQQSQWSAGGLVGWVYADVNLSGTRIKDNYPQGNIFGTYSPNDKNQVEVTYAFGKQVPDTYQKSPNMLQQDELMWYAGTPGLDNYWNHRADATYTWLPNNKWQLSLNGAYFIADNRVTSIYTPTAPNGTMLRQYLNDGNFSWTTVTANATAKFFGGKLIARVSPMYTHYSTTGEYAQKMDGLQCTAQLTWYFGNFYLFGWYTTPRKDLSQTSGIKDRTPSRYQLQIGYGKGAWRASATAYNFLRSSWESSRETLTSQYYQFDRRTYGTAQHMRFQFSVTYTFGYGKKIQRGNEVSGSGTGQSAILK